MSGLKESIENLLELKDEVMRAYYDPLGEDGVFSYSAKEKEPGIKQDSRDKESSDPAFCRSCPLWQARLDDYFYFNPKKASLLCVIPSVEQSGKLLKDDAMEMYENQMTGVLNVPRGKRALLPLIKCPTPSFDSSYADSCRKYLRAEMLSFEPDSIILFGIDLAHYMLRTDLPYERIRAREREFHINGIRTFATYSQRECIEDKRLKRAVYEDLLRIREVIS